MEISVAAHLGEGWPHKFTLGKLTKQRKQNNSPQEENRQNLKLLQYIYYLKS